ncbi:MULTISPECIES: hypothetical protein [unclassified Bradyrhizobium]|uniref:hypothetical protein n=1 Tax=unclassified Bradyrhizobium TaxID=2631580 RepID=UPI003395F5E4
MPPFSPGTDNRVTCTTSVYVLAPGVARQIAAQNKGRRYLLVQNVGNANPATIKTDTNPSAQADGMGLDPATTAAGGQGGSWEPAMVPSNAINAISTLGTTLVVIEGI